MQVGHGHHQLAVAVDQAQLDLLHLTDVAGPEAKAGDDGKRGPAGELGQVEGAETAAQRVHLAIGRHYRTVGEEGKAQLHGRSMPRDVGRWLR